MVKFRRNNLLSDLWISSNDRLSDFYASSWQRGDSPLPLLLVRLLLATSAVGILIWSMVAAKNTMGYWPIYLTNWAITLVAVTMVCAVAVSCTAVFKKSFDTYSGDIPWFVSMYWFMYNISVTIALMVTALYWILLYDPDVYWENCTRSMFALDLSSHALISCIALIEVLTSRTPVRLLHLYQPLGIALWYLAFTAIYFATGGTDGNGNPFVYEVLDWRHGRQTLSLAFFAMIGLLIMYTVLWALAFCRDTISLKFLRGTNHNLPSLRDNV